MGEWPFQTGDNDTRSNYDPSDPLRLIAKYQRWVIFSLLAGILLGCCMLFLYFGMSDPPGESAQWAWQIIAVPVNTMMIVSAYMLSKQFYGDAVSLFIAICMSLPLMSLILLLVINQKATNYLTRQGVKVGLFGASQKQI